MVLGDVVLQGKAYTIDVLHELMKDYEREWVNADLAIKL